jgi:hypothetical protein
MIVSPDHEFNDAIGVLIEQNWRSPCPGPQLITK